MAKESLKQNGRERQSNLCVHCGLSLTDDEMRLLDTHRKVPKRDGGVYTPENYVIEHPVCHMKAHGIFRSRPEDFEDLKAKFDIRVQIMKLKLKIGNQVLAFERKVDHLSQDTLAMLEGEQQRYDRMLDDADKPFVTKVKDMAKDEPLIAAALSAPGCGPITTGAMAIYIDLSKARHPSSLWKYVGLDRASHERYTKGEASGGNKTLRTVLYNFACSTMKMNNGNPYRVVYDQVKSRLAVSEKIVKSRNTQGNLVEVAWKDAKPSHRHGAALRAVMKTFLADYWFVGRTLLGLPVNDLYVKEHLGHESAIINPKERGWEY